MFAKRRTREIRVLDIERKDFQEIRTGQQCIWQILKPG